METEDCKIKWNRKLLLNSSQHTLVTRWSFSLLLSKQKIINKKDGKNNANPATFVNPINFVVVIILIISINYNSELGQLSRPRFSSQKKVFYDFYRFWWLTTPFGQWRPLFNIWMLLYLQTWRSLNQVFPMRKNRKNILTYLVAITNSSLILLKTICNVAFANRL